MKEALQRQATINDHGAITLLDLYKLASMNHAEVMCYVCVSSPEGCCEVRVERVVDKSSDEAALSHTYVLLIDNGTSLLCMARSSRRVVTVQLHSGGSNRLKLTPNKQTFTSLTLILSLWAFLAMGALHYSIWWLRLAIKE